MHGVLGRWGRGIYFPGKPCAAFDQGGAKKRVTGWPADRPQWNLCPPRETVYFLWPSGVFWSQGLVWGDCGAGSVFRRGVKWLWEGECEAYQSQGGSGHYPGYRGSLQPDHGEAWTVWVERAFGVWPYRRGHERQLQGVVPRACWHGRLLWGQGPGAVRSCLLSVGRNWEGKARGQDDSLFWPDPWSEGVHGDRNPSGAWKRRKSHLRIGARVKGGAPAGVYGRVWQRKVRPGNRWLDRGGRLCDMEQRWYQLRLRNSVPGKFLSCQGLCHRRGGGGADGKGSVGTCLGEESFWRGDLRGYSRGGWEWIDHQDPAAGGGMTDTEAGTHRREFILCTQWRFRRT